MGQRPRQQRLAGARRPVEEDAPRRPRSPGPEGVRLPHRQADRLQLGPRRVLATDVREAGRLLAWLGLGGGVVDLAGLAAAGEPGEDAGGAGAQAAQAAQRRVDADARGPQDEPGAGRGRLLVRVDRVHDGAHHLAEAVEVGRHAARVGGGQRGGARAGELEQQRPEPARHGDLADDAVRDDEVGRAVAEHVEAAAAGVAGGEAVGQLRRDAGGAGAAHAERAQGDGAAAQRGHQDGGQRHVAVRRGVAAGQHHQPGERLRQAELADDGEGEAAQQPLPERRVPADRGSHAVLHLWPVADATRWSSSRAARRPSPSPSCRAPRRRPRSGR